MQNIKTKTVTGFLWLLVGNGFQSILKLVVLAVLARLLTPEDFGIVAISTVLLSFSKILVDLGVGPALVQKKVIDQGHISSGFFISVLLSLCLASTIYLFRAKIGEFLNVPELYDVLPIIAIIFIFKSFCLVHESIALKELQFKRLAVIEFTSYFIGYAILSILLASLGYGYFSIVWAVFAQELIRTLLVVSAFKVNLTLGVKRVQSFELLSFGFGNTLGQIANNLGNSLDQMMLSKYAGVGLLGVYSRAYQLGVMPLNIIGSSVNKVLFSSFSIIQDEKERLRRNYYRACALASLLVLPLIVILYSQADAIIYFVLGSKWSTAAPVLQLMAFGMLFRLINKINDSIARALGIIYKRAVVQCVFAILVGCGSYYFVSYGLSAVIWCVNAALAVNFILMTTLISREINIKVGRLLESISTGFLAALIVLSVVVGVDVLFSLAKVDNAQIISMFIVLVVSLAFLVLGVLFTPDLLFRKESVFLQGVFSQYTVKIGKILTKANER